MVARQPRVRVSTPDTRPTNEPVTQDHLEARVLLAIDASKTSIIMTPLSGIRYRDGYAADSMRFAQAAALHELNANIQPRHYEFDSTLAGSADNNFNNLRNLVERAATTRRR